MSANNKSGGRKIVAQNKKAWHEYFVDEKYEAGIALFGTEVKSIRNGAVNLKDAWEWGWGEAGHNSLSTLHTVRHRRLDCPLLDLGAV